MRHRFLDKKRLPTSAGSRAASLGRKPPRLRIALLSSNAVIGEYVMRALHALGAKTILLHDRRLAASLRFSRCCESVLLACEDLGAEPPARILELINQFHLEQQRIDAVLASDLVGLLHLASIKSELLMPVYPMAQPDTLLTLSDKWLFYNLCTRNDVTVPKAAYFASKSDIAPEEMGDTLGFPLVVKPVAMFGSIGFQFVDSRNSLEERVLRNPAYDYTGLLVQRYVAGPDWGLSVFARSGRIERWTTFACREHWGTEFAEQLELREFGDRLIRATGFDGVANFDARLDSETRRIHLLECNPRFFVRTTATRLCGLDFVQAGLAAIGLTDANHSDRSKGSFYSAGQLLTRAGVERLLMGNWPLRPLLGNLAEIAADPLPVAARRFGLNAQPAPRNQQKPAVAV
jgi:biotin carboxylase